MTIERKYTYTCDECGHQVVENRDENFTDDWLALYRSWNAPDGNYESEEFNFCSDECAAIFDPREHRSYT